MEGPTLLRFRAVSSVVERVPSPFWPLASKAYLTIQGAPRFFFSGTHRVSFDGEKGTLICLAQTGGAQGALSLQNAVHQRRKAGQDEKRREKNHHVFAIANKIVIAIPTMKKTRPKITLKSADHHGLPLEPGVLADPAHPFRRKISTAGGTLALPVRVMNAAPSTGEYEASVVRPNPGDKSDFNRSRHSQSDRQSA